MMLAIATKIYSTRFSNMLVKIIKRLKSSKLHSLVGALIKVTKATPEIGSSPSVAICIIIKHATFTVNTDILKREMIETVN